MVGIESGRRARSPADPLCLQPFPIHSWGAAGGAHLAAAVPLTALPLGQPPCLAPPLPCLAPRSWSEIAVPLLAGQLPTR